MADFQEICIVENHANLVKDTDIDKSEKMTNFGFLW